MVRISEWLTEGWALVKDDIMTFAVAMLLAGLVGGLTLGICMPPLIVGLYMMAFAKMKGEPVAIGDVFKGFQKFGPSFIAFLIIGVAVAVVGGIIGVIPVIGQIVAPLIGFVIGAAVFYTGQLIAVSEISPIEAIKQSFEKVKDNFLMYCVAALVFGVVNSIGSLVCGIGALVTGPVVIMAGAIAYRDNFGNTFADAPPYYATSSKTTLPNFGAPAAPVAPTPPTPMPAPEPPQPAPKITEPYKPENPIQEPYKPENPIQEPYNPDDRIDD